MKATGFFFMITVFFFSRTVLQATEDLADLKNAQNMIINGQEMIYYPDLKIQLIENGENETSKIGDRSRSLSNLAQDSNRSSISSKLESQQTSSKTIPKKNKSSDLLQGTKKIYGYVNGMAVVKKETQAPKQRSENVSKSTFTNVSPIQVSAFNGYVLYNLQRNQFEYTDGIIQVEMNSDYKNIDLESLYELSIIHAFGNYLIIKPKNPDDFAELYSELSKDQRIEYATLYFLPPKRKPQ